MASNTLKMLRVDIDYDALDLDDPTIVDALTQLEEEVKYNTMLYNFLDIAYDWQRDVAALTKDHTVIGTISANRVGKSEIGCAIATCHLTGIYPDWWEGKKFTKPIQLVAACLNSDLNKTVLQAKLFGTPNWRMKSEIGSGMIPLEFIDIKSGVSGRGDGLDSIAIKHITGGYSHLYFRAYSQGREAAQGVEADVVLIDEQPKDDFWSECLTRLATTNGHAVCSFTPLKSADGLVETLVSLPEVKGAPYDKFGVKRKSDGDLAMVRASWDDITHITDRTKETLRKGYLPYERDARIYGIAIAGHGRIFPYQKTDITYCPRETLISPHFPHLIGIDIGHGHGRDPSAAIQVAWDESRDIVYVTRGKTESTDTTRDLARLLAWIDHTNIIAWPSDANRASMNAQSSVADQLRQLDFKLLGKPFMNPRGADGKRNNFKAVGIAELNQRFAEGRLLISDECTDLLTELEQYSYTETGKIQDGRDHAIDAWRYAVMSIIQGYGEPLKEAGWGSTDEDYEDYHYNSY